MSVYTIAHTKIQAVPLTTFKRTVDIVCERDREREVVRNRETWSIVPIDKL